jgi:hypothetical protein
MPRPMMPNFLQCSPERRARAAKERAYHQAVRARASQAESCGRDERADLLNAAVNGDLRAQLRCVQLYGKKWERLAAAVLAVGSIQRENSST